MNSVFSKWRRTPFWIRMTHWEYWNFNIVYLPIYPFFIFLCLRARSFFFFSASNPGIENGGFLAESKKEIIEMVPPHLQPKTIFFKLGSKCKDVLNILNEANFNYPLIGKPDIGARGRGIKKIDNDQDLCNFISLSKIDFHIQEFVDYEHEAGIFYYRFPEQEEGHISGIVTKEFLKVTGDGIKTVRDLLLQNPRGLLQIKNLEIQEPELLKSVPSPGELKTVVPYGNHARGALFIDDTDSNNQKLEKMIDQCCRQIPGFYFGRLDIRYQSWELLSEGKSFSIIEVNGAGSEPTHIYDPRHSILFGWKEIIRHLLILSRISRANHRLGIPYLSFRDGIRMYQKNISASRKLESMMSNK